MYIFIHINKRYVDLESWLFLVGNTKIFNGGWVKRYRYNISLAKEGKFFNFQLQENDNDELTEMIDAIEDARADAEGKREWALLTDIPLLMIIL